jgi:hypothetical protein
VTARASADAAILFAPSVEAQAIKFPESGTLGIGTTSGAGFQVRTQLSLSPLDIYRGFRVLRVGDADCLQHEAFTSAEEVVKHGLDLARLPALRRKARVLGEARRGWEQIALGEEARLAAHTMGLVEMGEVRTRTLGLERELAQTLGAIATLEARGVPSARARPEDLAAAAEASALRFEREADHVRSLDAWKVSATGGVIPTGSSLDTFGIVQVGFNLGSFARNAADTRHLEARQDELRTARYELAARIHRLQGEAKAAADAARQELASVERHVTTVAAAENALEGSEAPHAPHVRAVLELDRIRAESDRAYLESFVSELAHLENR